MTRVAVLGAGAWGTAVAIHVAGRAAERSEVVLWARDAEQARVIDAARENPRYLPGIAIPAAASVTHDLGAVRSADVLLSAVPMAGIADLIWTLASAGIGAPLVLLAKGFVSAPDQPGGVALSHQYLAPRWPAP